MNARVKPPAEGEAEIVKLPAAEAPRPSQPEQPAAPPPPPRAETPAKPRAEEPEQKKRRPIRLILMIVVPLILVLGFFAKPVLIPGAVISTVVLGIFYAARDADDHA